MNTPSYDLRTLHYRHYFYQAARNYFYQENFIEIETPILIKTNTPDPHIDPITASTKFASFQMHTSPEVWLKKALQLGAENIFQIGRVFRDDPPSAIHSHEFSMLEWYRVGADLSDLIKDCEKLFELAEAAGQKALLPTIKRPAFVHYDIDSLFTQMINIDLSQVLSATLDGREDCLADLLRMRGDHLPKDSGFEDAFFHVMLKYIEPNLPKDQVSVLNKWPIQLAALSEQNPQDDRYCQRFELYFGGIEIANAYQECQEPKVLCDRFNRENETRKKMDKPLFLLDYELINALVGLPKTAGIALGIDRLLLSMTGSDHLNQIIFGYQKQ